MTVALAMLGTVAALVLLLRWMLFQS